MNTTEVIERINKILGGLAACKLEFQTRDVLNSKDWDDADLRLLLSSKDLSHMPKYITAKSTMTFGFPIRVNGILVGIASLNDWPTAMPQELIALAELLAVVIEERLALSMRSQTLKSLEDRLRIQEKPGNVTPLRITRLEQVRRSIAEIEKEKIESDAGETGPLLLEGEDETTTARLAFELHERSGRWAFLSLEDLATDILETRDNLKSLGGITLFIRDLAALTTKQQIRLAEYLAIQPSKEMPQVIASVRRFEDFGRVMPHLLAYFSRAPEMPTSSSISDKADEISVTAIGPVNNPANANRGRLIPFSRHLLDPDPKTLH